MKRIRHCACRHLPERADQLEAMLAPLGLSLPHLHGVVHTLYGAPAGDRRHDRALRHVSAPDAHGHMRWIGPLPLNAGPRVQYQQRRIPPAHWLWLRAGRPDAPLVRTCHDPQCISPEHHDLERAPSVVTKALTHADLAEFDRARPKINARPKKWDHADGQGERCLRAGHPLTVYGDPRLRRTYCKLCSFDERKRLRDRSTIEARVKQDAYGMGRTALDYADEPAALSVDDIPNGPTLVEQYLATLETPDDRN